MFRMRILGEPDSSMALIELANVYEVIYLI